MLTLQAQTYIEGNELVGPFRTIPQEPLHPENGAKLDHIIQLNYREVHIHASRKITRTWENFNKQGTKLILLSDKLWLIAIQSFVNGSKSIIRDTFRLCNFSEIYLI